MATLCDRFLATVNLEHPLYAEKCEYYIKNDTMWFSCDKQILLEKHTVLTGIDAPSDSIGENDNVYIRTSELRIHFTDYLFQHREMIVATHYGWTRPYDIKPENSGTGDIRNEFINFDNHTVEKGLYLMFTSDDISELLYLVVEVCDENTLEIKYDYRHKRVGTKLMKVPTNFTAGIL